MASTVAQQKKELAKAHRVVLSLQKKMLGIQSSKSKAKPGLIKAKTQIEHVTRKLAEKRDALTRKEGEAEKQATELASLNAMLAEVDALASAFEASLPEALRVAGAGLGGEAAEVEATDELSSSLLNASSRLDEVLTREQLTEYHDLKAAAAAETGTLTQELASARRKVDDERSRLVVNQNKADEIRARISLLREQMGTLEARLSQGEAYVAKTSAERERKASAHATMASRVANTAVRMEEVTALLQETQAELQEVTAAQRKSSHEAKLAEALAAMKRLFPGVHGKVVHLCATQPKYQLALTVAMGRYVDAVVVDTQATAIECIEYMRENRIGTATFLPLNSLKVKAIDERFRSLGGTATLAVDVIEYDETFAPAFEFILGNTVLCQGLSEARTLAFATRGVLTGVRKKVVTWDGTKITKSGLITGGSAGDEASTAALWTEKRVEHCMKKRTEYEKELAALAQERRLKTQAERLLEGLNAIDARLSSAKADVAKTSDSLADAQTEATALEAKLEGLTPAIEALAAAVASGEARVAELEAQIAAVEDEMFGAFSRAVGVASIRELEQSAVAEAQRAAKKRLQFSKQRAKLLNQISYTSAADHGPEVAALKASIEADEARLVELQDAASAASAKMDALLADEAELTSKLAAAREAEEGIARQVKNLKADEVRLGKEAVALATAIASSEGAAEALVAKRQAIFQRCTVDEIPVPLRAGGFLTDAAVLAGGDAVEVDFSGLARALKAVDRATDRMPADKYAKYDAAFEERLRQISKDIETMAPNLKAIERLDELAAKFKETSAEFDHARSESKVANERFARIQKLRTDRYRDAYDHIARVIDEIYKELTKSELNYAGGTAFLSLESPEEPYLRGVKFNAMPPNKRFRNMEDLSGGEKTVAALALLFAIHSYRPSPFFVMDEVDAALDSKNVKRVAEYIRTRSSDFQCIADALVGVYRERADEPDGAASSSPSPEPEAEPPALPTFSRTLTLDLRDYA
ncbi:condensin complex component SMC1 [Thecamonas trahens ATCC 50062]|uniref:Condensin complex component SMC1 n=1 Tax=Thecamonas trahens ATCC 50062 TaxID=461836 RepID=A0A0L0DIE7_THETB|nr:condensin complex component SMC1 [Thecamonas trahens ATCC 50062]KNC52015.1 condensin complex component SMC1 [Thecamonas trahens ATCC 50062]|eukprot:XP_013755598.1 condensin complex component SMC1 [Thecamonas trahens ATCC 50062]